MSDDQEKTSGESDDDRTLGPDQTILSTPDISETIVQADTVEEVDPNATLKPVETIHQGPGEGGHAENQGDDRLSETFVASPADSTGHESAVDHDAAQQHRATDVTILSSSDMAVDQTIISQELGSPDGRKDLEDHFETLIQDAQNPGSGPDAPGGFVIGDYQVLGELGRGGMGVVYKARHRKLKRVVALKMILAGNHAGNEALERFITEARAVAHLQHPGIVQIFDIGEHNGLPFFSLEFVEGSDLQKKLDRQPQDPRFAAALVQKLAVAMQYAHDNGILHRDLKPPNVLLDADGEPKITDFGLAKQVDGDDASMGTTMGTIMGSPSYMPPEQARGEVSSLTPKSDLYSLGAVLYEMLTGRPPFLAQKPLETVMQVMNNEPVSPRSLQPGIPVDLETICLKTMQKDQAARYESCADLADDLGRFLEGKPILARPVSQTERAFKWCRRNPKIAIPSGLAISAIVLTAIIASWAWQTTAAQAVVIAEERDNAQEQRDEATKQRDIAESERQKAETQEAEAKRQRDIAQVQRKVAEEAQEVAVAQKALALKAQKDAEQKEEIARKQALVALNSIQYVVTEVDSLLENKPQLTDVRIALMKALSTKWDEIDVELAGGLQGEAIPTQMAVRFKIANALYALDQIEDANQEFEKLYEKGKERVVVKDQNDAARSNLVKILTAWSDVHERASEEPNAGIKLLEQARLIMQEIFQDPHPDEGSPQQTELLGLNAAVCQNLGVAYLRSGNLSKAAEAFGEALSSNGKTLSIVRASPGFDEKSEDEKDNATANLQMEYDRSAIALAYIQLRLGQTAESIRLYKQAIRGRREIYDRRPTILPLKIALAGFLSNFGNSYLWLDQPEDAKPLLEEAVRLSEEIYEQDTEIAGRARQLGLDYYRLATLRSLQGESDQAMELLQKRKAISEQLVEKTPDRKNQIELMLVEARLGNVEAAQNLIDELGAAEDKDAEVHLDRSRSLAQLSVHATSDEDRRKYVDSALTALERSVDDGYSDPFRLEHENDLDPLHQELRFQALIAKLKTTK